MAEVFILGAGFSRAISAQMPLVRDLIQPLADHLEGRKRTEEYGRLVRKHGDLEAVLTYLAEGQTWLDEQEKLASQSAFLAATHWLAEHVYERERAVLNAPCPDWLLRLVRSWHRERAAVITLNYDLLVEAAVETVTEKPKRLRYLDVVHADLPRVVNRYLGRNSWFSHEYLDTFRLLKLHGSLNWASDASGQVWDSECVRPFEAAKPQQRWTEVQAQMRELRPLIVPPITGKGSYLGGDWIRSQWIEAEAALRGTGRITIIGYSLPMSDIAMRLLLMTTVSSQQVRVVDVNPKAKAHLLDATGISAEATWADVEQFVIEDVGS